MEKERLPDPGNRDLDTSLTEDKINAYDAVASLYQAGIQQAIFLTHSFLQDQPILLEEGYLTVNWDWIPGLYSRTSGPATSFPTWLWWGARGYFTMLWTPSCRTRLAIL